MPGAPAYLLDQTHSPGAPRCLTHIEAALAGAELSEAYPVLASRLKCPRVAGPVTWRLPLGIYGPDEFPLSLR